MKRKAYLTVIAVVLLAALSVPAAFAVQNNTSVPAPKEKKQINLTEKQKSELKQLHNQMYDIKKQMIQKYLDFGVITKDQADKKLKRLEERQKMIEQNGFIRGYGKGGKRRSPKSDGQQPEPAN